MRIYTISFWKIYGSLFSYVLLGFSPVNAQITPDKTLLINSQLTHHSNTSIIEGGTIKGSNLFHSFEQFSVLPGTTAYFNNGISIQNIFTRVTGNSISNIDGILKANGTANFFLINPNGIIFGQHAQLNVGGSFFASTANTIKFSDGFEFKANVSQTTPLLTISTPIGLIIGNDSGAIQVIGTGVGLITPNSPVSPIIRNNDLKGLQLKPSKTLDLVGGVITLEGANITAEQGRIELGSVGDGIVSLRSNGQGWILNFEQVSSFKKISISQQSLIDASGNAGGSITVQAKDVSLENGSIFLIQNHDLPAGSINIKASNSFQLTGASTDGKFVSLLQTESLGSGKGADINISTNNLIAQQGASISARTYSSGRGGDVTVNAPVIKLLGFLPSNPYVVSSIITSSSLSALGNAGNITVSTERLFAQDGGLISSLTLGEGNGGNVFINARNSVEVTNSTELINSGQFYVPSYLTSQSFGNGNAGNLTINTPTFVVGNKAFANTSTQAFGDAGTLNINAFDLEVSGSVGSSATKANTETQQYFGAPPVPSGSPGEVNINAGRLSLINGGQVSVTNEGISTVGGKLAINADSVSLDNKSSIAASTASGVGGDIQVNVRYFLLNNYSSVTTSAENNGNGGNINIYADIVAGAKNSSITANAFKGRGGNITINAKGLFFSSDSSITASSKYGINGNVQYNIADPNFYPTEIKVKGISEAPQFNSGCQRQVAAGASDFVVSSYRGLQSNPDAMILNDMGQSNSSPIPAINNPQQTKLSTSKQPTQIIEANVLIRDSQGNLVLTTDQAKAALDNTSSPASSCFSASR